MGPIRAFISCLGEELQGVCYLLRTAPKDVSIFVSALFTRWSWSAPVASASRPSPSSSCTTSSWRTTSRQRQTRIEKRSGSCFRIGQKSDRNFGGKPVRNILPKSDERLCFVWGNVYFGERSLSWFLAINSRLVHYWFIFGKDKEILNQRPVVMLRILSFQRIFFTKRPSLFFTLVPHYL